MFTRREGVLTRFVEKKGAKIPSGLFLGAAVASVFGSALSYITGRKQLAQFIGEWAPTFLVLGLYSKVVKQAA